MKRLYLRWILANGWSEMLGLGGTGLSVWLLGRAFGESSSILAVLGTALGVVLVGATMEGALVGYAQARVLRAALPSLQPSNWVIATAIGAAAAWTLGMVPRTFFALSHATGGEPLASLGAWKFLLAAAMGLLLGPVLGVPQWLALRRHLARAGLWVPANALAWALGMPIIFLGASSLPTQPSIGQVLLAVGAACLLCGLCVGTVHGAVLIWMLSRVAGPTIAAAGPGEVASPCSGAGLTLAIFGITGATGRAVAQEALSRGWTVRGLVRPRSALPAHPRLTVIVGTPDDPARVQETLDGATAACCVLGPRPPEWAPFCAGATKTILDGMHQTGCRRLLVQTGAMIGEVPGRTLTIDHIFSTERR